jgi:hypothetical protein
MCEEDQESMDTWFVEGNQCAVCFSDPQFLEPSKHLTRRPFFQHPLVCPFRSNV